MGIEDYVADKGNAAIALMNWMNSQDITIHDSVPVLALTVASVIREIALTDDKPVNEVLANVIEMIEALVEDMEGFDEPK
jgi:hypothetical protein